MERRRIVFVMEDLCFGGTQRQTLQIARRLDRNTFDPVLLTLTGETDLDAEARESGLEVVHMGGTREVDLLFFVRLLHRLHNLKPDIIVPCTALPNIWARLWGRWLGFAERRAIAVVGTDRGGGALVRQYEKWLWNLCDHMICNSTELLDGLMALGVPSDRVTYIPNGVDTFRFAPATPEPAARAPHVVCVARLCEDKDHATLIRAFSTVFAACPRARLTMVGDGPWKEKVEALVSSSDAQYGISLLPGTADIRPHLASASIFALSSVREGQPNVLLEAMACGLPICATDVGGIPNLVEDGVNGLLCRAGDSDQLAANILRLINEPALAGEMSRANRERAVRDFSFYTAVKSHESAFDQAYERACQRVSK